MDPFSDQSIWNTSIGKDALLSKEPLGKFAYLEPEFEYLYRISNAPFVRPVFAINTWYQRLGNNKQIDQIPIDDFIIGSHPFDARSPDSCAAFLMPDHRTVKNLTAFSRMYRSGPCYAQSVKSWDIYGSDGLDDGRIDSGMSILGGAIRADACNTVDDIRHAIKICLPPSMLYGSQENTTFRWPAIRSGEQSSNRYSGVNASLTMGALLTLSEEDFQTVSTQVAGPIAKSIAKCIYEFGVYVVDDTGDNKVRICITPEAHSQVWAISGEPLKKGSWPTFPQAVTNDLKLVLAMLRVVEDNSSESIGGKEKNVDRFFGNRSLKKSSSPEPSSDHPDSQRLHDRCRCLS